MEKLSCDTCGKNFKNEASLKQHKNDSHKSQVSEVKSGNKKKFSLGKLLAILIPVAIVGLVFYGIYWSFTSQSIGSIGSTHIHADFAIYLDGKEITPLPKQFYVLSPYVHVETGPGEGSVLHIHATGVPLKMFFNSLGMKLDSNCFEITSSVKTYCTDVTNTLKMFVKHQNSTWEQNMEYGDYVSQDLDKILISYGSENLDQITAQQGNVTDFSKDNS